MAGADVPEGQGAEGDVPAGTLGRVKAGVEERLRIASPHYLRRYGGE